MYSEIVPEESGQRGVLSQVNLCGVNFNAEIITKLD
jgi:hypothetical protein